MINRLCTLALLVAAGDSGATTAAEEAMRNAPLPHTLLANTQARATVHRVSLLGYLDTKPDDAATLAMLKADVARCVANRGGKGGPVAAVKAWPEHVMSLREDIYAASNRTITYSHALFYTLDAATCGLSESVSSKAELVSQHGSCSVDLAAKTAVGDCDGSAHAKAPVAPPMPAGGAQMKQLAAMGLMVTATGVRKTVLGVSCEIHKLPRQLDADGTACLGSGGSFPVSVGPDGGLLMERRSHVGYTMAAREAKLDDQIGAAIFTPWLAGGFRVLKGDRQ